MEKKIIVIGPTSFIGIALIALFRRRGDEVTALVRPYSSRKLLLERLYPDLEILECQLSALSKMRLPKEEYDALFHIGWDSDFSDSRYNLEGQMQNVEYCLEAVELAHRYQCSSFLCVGSQAECGRVCNPIDSMTPDHPETAYAQAKCIAYERTADLCRRYGMRQYWPRLLSAYGPFDRDSAMIMSCIHACRAKQPLQLTTAEQIWDYVYVEDVAEALIAIWERGAPGKKYAIASGQGRKLREYITEIAEITGYPQLIKGIGKKDYADGQVMYLVGNIDELTNDTGFVLRWNFTEGMRETIRIFEEWCGRL